MIQPLCTDNWQHDAENETESGAVCFWSRVNSQYLGDKIISLNVLIFLYIGSHTKLEIIVMGVWWGQMSISICHTLSWRVEKGGGCCLCLSTFSKKHMWKFLSTTAQHVFMKRETKVSIFTICPNVTVLTSPFKSN